jgi:hypothetical protein
MDWIASDGANLGSKTGCSVFRKWCRIRVMEKVIRNVAEIGSADRRAIEHLIGKHLGEHQQVIISVVTVDLAPPVESLFPLRRRCPSGGRSTKD